ncbi:hypothetical protein LINPERHAP1_LOCUS22431 [Linum perenne]
MNTQTANHSYAAHDIGVPERPKLVSCSWMAVSRLPVFQTCALC